MSSDSPQGNSSPPASKRPGRFQRSQNWYKKFGNITGALAIVVILVITGTVYLVVMDTADYVFSTNKFCANTCHVMEINVFEELKESKHWNTPTGVRPTCADCHVNRRLTFAMLDHLIGTGELFVWLTHDLDKPGAFEELRPAAADRVRFAMLRDDSSRCRDCHVMEAIKPKRIRGQKQHEEALERDITCIACHYNLTHKEVPLSPAFQKAINEARGLTDMEEETEEPVSGEEGEEVL